MTQHLVLVGLMGAGKTTVGHALADRLGRPFRDSDGLLEVHTGRTAAQLERELGADELHQLESTALLEVLAESGPAVISAAASVVEDPAAREALRAHRVVWLRAPVEVLAGRFRPADHRPLFGRTPGDLLLGQRRVRGPLYEEVADLVVDTGGRDVAAVVEEIVGWLEG